MEVIWDIVYFSVLICKYLYIFYLCHILTTEANKARGDAFGL